MGALTEFLFPAPAPRKATAILGWWEKRRLPFNLAVGAAGVASLGISYLMIALPPNGMFPGLIPWQPIVVFGLLANVCYLLGPTAEIIIEKLWGPEVLPTGPVLYRMGLTFSVGLALLPALLVTLFWVVRIVMMIF